MRTMTQFGPHALPGPPIHRLPLEQGDSPYTHQPPHRAACPSTSRTSQLHRLQLSHAAPRPRAAPATRTTFEPPMPTAVGVEPTNCTPVSIGGGSGGCRTIQPHGGRGGLFRATQAHSSRGGTNQMPAHARVDSSNRGGSGGCRATYAHGDRGGTPIFVPSASAAATGAAVCADTNPSAHASAAV